MPSVLSDAPAWVDDLVQGGPAPRRYETTQQDISAHRRSGWIRGALLGAAVVAVLGALVLRFGGFESARQAVSPKPAPLQLSGQPAPRDTPSEGAEGAERAPHAADPGPANSAAPAAAADTSPDSEASHAGTPRPPTNGGGGWRPALRPAAPKARVNAAPDPGVPENPY